jgi:hypothetical protein
MSHRYPTADAFGISEHSRMVYVTLIYPIRPGVNWINVPAYKLAKKLVVELVTHTPLPYTFNVSNTSQLINDLTDIPYDRILRLASFYINNMYTNTP